MKINVIDTLIHNLVIFVLFIIIIYSNSYKQISFALAPMMR